MPGKKKIDVDEFDDDDAEAVDVTEETVAPEQEASLDVLEMADIYTELSRYLGGDKITIKPTSEDIQKMVTSLFIHRHETDKYRKAPSGPTPDFKTADKMVSQPAKPPTKIDAGGEYRTCANCGKQLPPKYKEGSKRPYYSCYTCKGTTWDDDSFHKWPNT